MAEWRITYKVENGTREIQDVCYNKMWAIKHYLDLLDGTKNDVCELKIFKNGKDYTVTLNKFLHK